MTDIAVQHVLTTPGGTINFNDGSPDQFYLTRVPGLDGVSARVVVDKVPYGDGGVIHPAWWNPRYFQPEGSLLITSTRIPSEIVTIRNTMEAALIAAHESLLQADGTWAYTPLGQSAISLTVRRDEQQVDFVHADNYTIVDFTFGMVAAIPYAV